MEKIKSNCVISSVAYSVPKSSIKYFDPLNKKRTEAGDQVFGEVHELGHHGLVDSRLARLHTINIGARAILHSAIDSPRSV